MKTETLMRKIVLLVLAVPLVASGAVELPGVKPAKGPVSRWVTLPGTLAPWQQAVVRSRIDGHLASVRADRGDRVKAGQVLAVVEAPEIEADLAKGKAAVAAAGVEVGRLRAAREKSPALVLPQALDDAEARLAAETAAVQRIEALLRFTAVVAPFDGIVTERRADPGELVNGGDSALFGIVDLATVRVRVAVPEAEVRHVSVGRPVEIRCDALGAGEPVMKGTVARMAYALDAATRTMAAEVDLPNEGMRLRPGFYVNVRLSVEDHPEATWVPAGAVVMEKANAFVFRWVDGQAHKTAVQLGFQDGERVEIPSLRMEDTVLLPGPLPLADRQAVVLKP